VIDASRERATGGAAGSSRRAPGQWRLVGAAVLACLLPPVLGAGSAWAQDDAPGGPVAPTVGAPLPDTAASQAVNLPPRLSVEVREAATNNTGLDDNGMRQGDFITTLRPALDVTHKGASINTDLHASALLVDYARHTQPHGVLPDVRGSVDATLLDRWLKLDLAGYLRTAESDPFGVRPNDTTTTNNRNQWGLLAAPALQHDLDPETDVLVRHQFGVTRGAGSATGDEEVRLDTNLTLVRLDRKPTPLGGSAELTRLANRTSSNLGNSSFTVTTGRLKALLEVGGDTRIGAVVGQDRTEYLLSSHTDPLYGGTLEWAPGPRTQLKVDVEHRFFGESGQISLQHRTPFLMLSVNLLREPVDATSSFGTLAQGVDLRSALDAILTTRYPDPATRAGIVDGIVAGRGLDTHGNGAIDLLGDYPQLQTAAQGAITLFGARDTLSLAAYAMTMRALTRDGDPLSGLVGAGADNRQRGGTLQLEHRLAAQLSATLLGNWSKIEGLGEDADRSVQQTWRISLLDHLSRRSDLALGVQWSRFETTAPGQRSFDATLGLVGLTHRF